MPLISVLLPVYNGAADIERSVNSILTQSCQDFELLIINDGSKDHSAAILNGFKDARIRLFHQENRGLAATLNRGISLARGKYIARQDQDDLSHTERLEKQVAYLEQNPECALLGTAAEIWVGDLPTERVHDHPVSHPLLCFDLLFNNPFVHSSVMLRRDALEALGGYSTDPMRQPPEDYELWSRVARQYRVANLKDRLLVYREVPQSMSRVGPNPFLDRLVTICSENLAFANGLDFPDQACNDAAALTHSAKHRLSKKINIERVSELVLTAGQKIAADFECPEVLKRAEERANILRYQFMMHRTNTDWMRPVLRGIRSVARRLKLR